MKGVILAAGKGTRMLPLTERRPKPLVPVLDRPILEHIVVGARDAGVDEIALIIQHLGEAVIDHFGDGNRLGVRIEYIWQGEPRGTGHAALMAEDFVAGEPFFMSWGDILVPPENYQAVVRAFQEDEPDAVLSLNYVEDPFEGAAVYQEDGYVTRIQEKPPKGTSTTTWNNAGVFVYRPAFFDRLRQLTPSVRGEIELPDAVQAMIREGRRIRAVKLEGYWSDVARPATVLELNARMMEHRYRDQHGMFIDPTAEVDDGCVVKPTIHIGAGCRLTNCRVGPNTVLMDGCRVEDNAQLRNVAVFTGATIGAGSVLTRCIVEENAVVPEGTELRGERARPMIVRPDGQAEQAVDR